MRDCIKNQRIIYIARCLKTDEPILDEDGNKTGSFENIYETPTPIKLNPIYKGGKVDYKAYGLTADYEYSIKTTQKGLNIDEKTLFWIKDDYSDIRVGNHNYIVSVIAPSLNTTIIYLKKVST